MERTDLDVSPYTISEALVALNKHLDRKIKIEHLYNLIYNKVKPSLIRKRDGGDSKGARVLIKHNEIVKIYDHIIESNKVRYSTNGRKKATA